MLAERAVLVPIGASLLARDNVVSTVKGLASKYGTRSRWSVSSTASSAAARARAIASSGRSVGPAPSSNANSGSVAAASSARFCRSAGASSARCARSVRISRSSPGRFLRVQPSSSRTPRSASAQRPRTIFPRRRPGERRQRERFAGLISSPADEAPSPPSTAGASRKWRPVGL